MCLLLLALYGYTPSSFDRFLGQSTWKQRQNSTPQLRMASTSLCNSACVAVTTKMPKTRFCTIFIPVPCFTDKFIGWLHCPSLRGRQWPNKRCSNPHHRSCQPGFEEQGKLQYFQQYFIVYFIVFRDVLGPSLMILCSGRRDCSGPREEEVPRRNCCSSSGAELL